MLNENLDKRANEQAEAPPETVTIVTCMKDEGPFILEWIAYHYSIGVTNFIIFSNDCTDGTDLILDRLDEMGIITHLPNPAIAAGSTYFQPIALKFAAGMPLLRRSDVVISMDVDEYIVIKNGKGTLKDLFEATGPFHALSMSEVNFNSGGHIEYEPGWVTELFKAHQTKTPGKWKAHRGVKTILRSLAALDRFTNHRPHVRNDFLDHMIWLDGSGKRIDDEFMRDPANKGLDCRNRFGLVQLNHYPLRSVDSFIAKKKRGDVVVNDKSVSMRYYRLRHGGGAQDNDIASRLPEAHKAYAELLVDDTLAKLQAYAEEQHAVYIAEALQLEEYAQFKKELLENFFSESKE